MTEATPGAAPSAASAAIVTRPTTKSEWTLIGALIAACILAIIIVQVMALPRWPDAVAPLIIQYFGRALEMAIGGILLVVIAIISPWVGVVKASGMGAQMEIDGDKADG